VLKLQHIGAIPDRNHNQEKCQGVDMNMRLRVTGFLVTAVLALPTATLADTQTAAHPTTNPATVPAIPHPTATPATTHRTHKIAKKEELPPPLPSGTRGPVPQVPLDAIPPIAPQVTYQDGFLTIDAPNSTLGDILRSVRKHTSAEIEIPPAATERVVTRLGPAPAREVMAELLNGSRFNYILLGSPEDTNALVRVVLVAKTGPETPPQTTQADGTTPPPPSATTVATPDAAEAADDATTDDSADQSAVEADQQPADQPGAKSPQQLLQEMQQRQLLLQQQQGANPQAPGMPAPHQPQPQQDQ
jgi:hypothetical protein